MLTFEQIKELIELVTESRLQGVEIERSGFRLKIDGSEPPPAPVVESAAAQIPPPAAPAPPAASPLAVQARAAEAPPAAESEDEAPEGSHVLNSPIVGTFYSAPSPDSEPYARVGDRVKKGQVLCIIEAMKLMNEIESDADGKLLRVYPTNAQPVEYGERLFAIQLD